MTEKIYVEGDPRFEEALLRLDRRGVEDLAAVEPSVREILAAVRAEGDEAVRRFIARFERREVTSTVLTSFDGAGALARLPEAEREALILAAKRIAAYHERQREVTTGFSFEEEGVSLGMRVRPIRRAGVYAPGGKARYPSSVLMTAIPARVAGVREIVLATPAPNDALYAAAHLAGVTEILDAGGAHAIGALAYGTASLRRVDKIVGPGNAYVTCAKRLVFGEVAIDGLAGPSEILVVADETADASIVAADLLSQAEHDEAAYALLATTSEALARATFAEVRAQLATLERRTIAAASIEANAYAFVVGSRARLAALADRLAAEHLAIHTRDPAGLFESIGAAGAALLGASTPVAAGDYLAGPSHVLPTGGAARFGSPLGVHDFITRASVLAYSAEAIAAQGPHIIALANAEGLHAHGLAVARRIERPADAESRPSSSAPSRS